MLDSTVDCSIGNGIFPDKSPLVFSEHLWMKWVATWKVGYLDYVLGGCQIIKYVQTGCVCWCIGNASY
jgi:hypothetical protein